MLSLIYVWINDWVNNREAGDLRRHRVHYDATVMVPLLWQHIEAWSMWLFFRNILKTFHRIKLMYSVYHVHKSKIIVRKSLVYMVMINTWQCNWTYLQRATGKGADNDKRLPTKAVVYEIGKYRKLYQWVSIREVVIRILLLQRLVKPA